MQLTPSSARRQSMILKHYSFIIIFYYYLFFYSQSHSINYLLPTSINITADCIPVYRFTEIAIIFRGGREHEAKIKTDRDNTL